MSRLNKGLFEYKIGDTKNPRHFWTGWIHADTEREALIRVKRQYKKFQKLSIDVYGRDLNMDFKRIEVKRSTMFKTYGDFLEHGNRFGWD